MVKVTNPGLTSSDKDKYLAAVKQHEKMEEEMIAKAAETATEKSVIKQDSTDSDSLKDVTDEKASSVSENDNCANDHTESQNVDSEKSTEQNMTEEKQSDKEEVSKVVNISENSEDIIIDVDSMETESEQKQSEKLTATIENIEIDKSDLATDGKMDITTEIKTVVSEPETSSASQPMEEQPVILSNKESLEGIQVTSNNDKNVKIQISVDNGDIGKGVTIPRSVASTDVTKPLTIETKFGGPSGPSSESTDTASEGGSCFSSPNTNSCQNSPQCSNGEGMLFMPQI